MANESLPDRGGEDPTSYWIELIRQSMTSETGTMPLPVGEELPVPVLDAERQAAIALDTGFTQDEITMVEHYPGGDCSITTTREDEYGTERMRLTFKLYGPPPKVGDIARIYRAEVGLLPRGLVIVGDDQQEGAPDRLQFYQTDQEYADQLEREQAEREQRTEEELRSERDRFDDLPPTLQAHVELMNDLAERENMPQLILQAEQAHTLAQLLPSPNALNGMRNSTLGNKLSILSNFIHVEGWDEEQANAIFDLAIFYLETREKY